MTSDCPNCDGTGYADATDGYSTVPCGFCGTTGHVHWEHIQDRAGIRCIETGEEVSYPDAIARGLLNGVR